MLTASRKRTELFGLRESGVEKFQKSIFNRHKWLPLCNETQFKISHRCCNVMKKAPAKAYATQYKVYPILGTLTDESLLREKAWIIHGCNAYNSTTASSQPLSFWKEQDILRYILENDIEIASVYGDIVPDPNKPDTLKCSGCSRTGCVFCGFGCHLEKGETRFQRLAKTHPKQYEYCMRGGQWVDNPEYDPAAPKMDGAWQNWNPKRSGFQAKKAWV